MACLDRRRTGRYPSVGSMEYRILGRTGLRVSKIGFGASPLGAEFGTIDTREGERAVHRAIDEGINYFDVAPYYGRTLAESRLGEYLSGRRGKVVLASKVGRYDITDFDYSPERVRLSVDESLRRLRTDYLDLCQVHDVEYSSIDRLAAETLPVLFDLKRSGKVRFVGITGYPVGVLKRLIERTQVDTVLSYCRYDLLDSGLAEVLAPAAVAKSVGIINGSPLHMRALTDNGAPGWHPAPQRLIEACARAAELCRREGGTLSELAMEYALANESVAVTLVGMSKVRHVEANTAILAKRSDPQLLERVLEILEPVRGIVWKEGRPENDDPGATEKRTLGMERNDGRS